MFTARSVDDLVMLARAGGGFHLKAAPRSADDLAMIAKAAADGHCRVTFSGMAPRPIDDLVMIARAGAGAVFFED